VSRIKGVSSVAKSQKLRAKNQQPLFSIQFPQPFLIHIHGHASSDGERAHASGPHFARKQEHRIGAVIIQN
jgi:hypothetical protein